MNHSEYILWVIGLIAAILTVVSFLPLAYRVFKIKQTFDVSMWFCWIILFSSIIWVVYGILLFINLYSHPPVEHGYLFSNKLSYALSKTLPLILTDSTVAVLQIIIIFIKINIIKKAKLNNISEKEYCDSIYKNMEKKNKKTI
ncbi:MAG: SemiSWEET family sugar transporter [Mycoplasmoidaceae bacterium]